MIIRKFILLVLIGSLLIVELVIVNRLRSEAEASERRIAHCQFLQLIKIIRKTSVSDRIKILTHNSWYESIDLSLIKAKCGVSMKVINGALFDSLGTKVDLQRTEKGSFILTRIGGKYQYFFRDINLTSYEFKTNGDTQ